MPDVKIGLIGLDTSHAVAFSRCFNKPGEAEHVPGGRVVAAFPGVSKDFELSYSRVDKFTAQVRDDFGVTIMDTPETVAEAVDMVFIIAVDGRMHLDHVRRTIPFRRPTFIDKPFATSSQDAKEMFNLAEQHGVPMMSCSSLRYAQPLIAAIEENALGNIVAVDAFGPMNIEPTQGGLFWYGIHTVEMINRVMGRGCREVKATTTDHQDLITGTWPDGRVAAIRGLRNAHHKFGVTIHREKGFQQVDCAAGKRSWYASMLEAVMRSLPQGKSDIEPAETLEIVRLIEAANESRATGKSVAL